MTITRSGGGEARVVGGAVRDALLGRAVKEIDFASTLPPEKTAALMKQAGIKTVPTGIEHGTITVVVDGEGYEITTLRHDIETDGRRAKVAFTDDWQGDAARRDFTMNALYMDADGTLYDFFDGRADLAADHVRFIGDARQRIREDVLRILRFFRFYAWFGRGAMDADGFAACRELAGLIPQLSVERVWREIVKLLTAPDPAPCWRLMMEAGVVEQILPEASDVARLDSLIAVERHYETPQQPLRRLAAVVTGEAASTMEPPIAQRLKLSKREAIKLQKLVVLPALLNGKLDPVPFRRALYENGVEDACDAALLCAAAHPATDLDGVFETAATWNNPRFPLQGSDLLKLGMQPGAAVGKLLRTLEEAWIAADFRPTREECLAMAKPKIDT